jgi:hypothetical protein
LSRCRSERSDAIQNFFEKGPTAWLILDLGIENGPARTGWLVAVFVFPGFDMGLNSPPVIIMIRELPF